MLALAAPLQAQTEAVAPDVAVSANEPPPPVDDAASAAALARADRWLDEYAGDSSLLEAARIEIERVLKAQPDSVQALMRHARYLVSHAMRTSSDYDPVQLAEAERTLDRALRIEPANAAAHLARAEVYELQGRVAEARSGLQRAEALGADPPQLHDAWADVLQSEGQYAAALARCERVRDAGRQYRDWADRCSISPLWSLRRYDEVDRRYARMVESAPDSAWTHGNRARFLLCTRRGTKRAVESADRALSIMEYGNARSTLAAALYTQWAELANAGKHAQAEVAWARAVAFMPGAPAAIVGDVCHTGFAWPVLKALRDTQRGPLFSPVQTVLLAAEQAPEWLPGVYALKVQGGGQGRGREAGQVFLNSESDYRDPRSVTVRFTPEAADAYRRKHGSAPDIVLRGKWILVYGYARQARIDFTQAGMPTGKYYFQTHIVVTDPDQVAVHDPDAPPPPPPPPAAAVPIKA